MVLTTARDCKGLSLFLSIFLFSYQAATPVNARAVFVFPLTAKDAKISTNAPSEAEAEAEAVVEAEAFVSTESARIHTEASNASATTGSGRLRSYVSLVRQNMLAPVSASLIDWTVIVKSLQHHSCSL